MHVWYHLIAMVCAIGLVACEASHISAAKSVCACFDVANYKIGKGHDGGGQNYERCRSELTKHLKRYEKDEKTRMGFMNALKTCPNATIVAPPKK